MKIVEAVWEKENLGCDVVEIQIDESDTVGAFEEGLVSINQNVDYICVKCAADNTAFLNTLPKFGFTFIEAQFELVSDVKNYKVPNKIDALVDLYRPRIELKQISSQEELDVILNYINSADMFKTDRIYLDPLFPKDASAKRYVNWCQTLFDEGALFFYNLIDGQNVAFTCIKKKNEKEYVSPLGGFYPEFNDYAFYSPVITAMLFEHYKTLGIDKLRTGVSSNNFPVLKMHLSSGYTLTNLYYVYTKHNERSR